MPYRTIVGHHLAQLGHAKATQPAAAAGDGGSDDSDAQEEVPPLLRLLLPEPTATPAAYRRLRADPLFPGQNARVCEDCYLAMAAYASDALVRRATATATATAVAVAGVAGVVSPARRKGSS